MNDRACEVPWIELAKEIPIGATSQWTDTDGLKAWHSAPVGLYLDAALARIRELEAALRNLVREAQAVADDHHSSRYFRLDEALASARIHTSDAPVVTKGF